MKVEALHPADIRCEATADGGTVELIIYGDIGASWWDDQAVTAKAVKLALAEFPNASLIKVRINSPGGNVFDGLAIYNILHNHSARIEVHVDSMALSAASIIAMAGDEIWMAENALMMIHEPWTCMCGSADDMRAEAAVLDKIAEQLVTTYAARTGLPVERCAELVKAETWMSADEAKDLGFATGVTEAKKAAASALRTNIRLEDFKNAPAKYRNAMRTMPENDPRLHLTDTEIADLKSFVDGRIRARLNGDQNMPPIPPALAPAAKTKEQEPMSNAFAAIAAALGLPVGSPESDIIARATTMRDTERDLMSTTGAESTARLAGVVKGFKAGSDKLAIVETELTKVRGERDKQNFSALLAKGQSAPVKLSPAQAKFYQDKFDAAFEKGTGAEVVDDLEGFLAVAPTIMSAAKKPGGESSSGAPAAAGETLVWNGKKYSELKPVQRARLAQENPELFRLMKDEFDRSR